jgi:hypothetical protein
MDDYEAILHQLEPLSALMIVSFDYVAACPLVDQMRDARNLFARYPSFASDFLCKPTAEDKALIDVEDFLSHIDELAEFDVVGITEKELGGSLLERCRNLVEIRRQFHGHGHSTPIHIFGSLDPGTILAYFFCGADIFDGLAWLRFSFQAGSPIYHVASIIANGNWTLCDRDVIRLNQVDNLRWLSDQQRLMRVFGRSHKTAELELLQPLLSQVVSLAQAAGVNFEE